MKQIAFVVGIAAVIIYLLGYQQKTRKKIIIFNATSRALYILQYILLGAFEGAAIDSFSAVSTISSEILSKTDAILLLLQQRISLLTTPLSLSYGIE